MYAAFTANTNYKTALMNDELHPNNAGYMVMANTWYAAISATCRLEPEVIARGGHGPHRNAAAVASSSGFA